MWKVNQDRVKKGMEEPGEKIYGDLPGNISDKEFPCYKAAEQGLFIYPNFKNFSLNYIYYREDPEWQPLLELRVSVRVSAWTRLRIEFRLGFWWSNVM